MDLWRILFFGRHISLSRLHWLYLAVANIALILAHRDLCHCATWRLNNRVDLQSKHSRYASTCTRNVHYARVSPTQSDLRGISVWNRDGSKQRSKSLSRFDRSNSEVAKEPERPTRSRLLRRYLLLMFEVALLTWLCVADEKSYHQSSPPIALSAISWLLGIRRYRTTAKYR